VCYERVCGKIFTVKPRPIFVAAVITGLIVVALAFHWLRGSEPRYHGRRFSAWLIIAADGPNGGPEELKEAEEAVQAIGTNAIPTLLTWLKTSPHRSRTIHQIAGKVEEFAPFVPAQDMLDKISPDRVGLAYYGFELLREKAAPAIPALVQMMQDTSIIAERREVCAFIVGGLGEAGLDELLALLAKGGEARRLAVIGMHEFSTITNHVKAAQAVPYLVEELRTPMSPVAFWSASALGYLGWEPQLAIPALTAGLTNSNPSIQRACVTALGKFGPLASNALPEIEKLRGTKGVEEKRIEEAVARICGTNGVGLGVGTDVVK
jgi:hypothetical protein